MLFLATNCDRSGAVINADYTDFINLMCLLEYCVDIYIQNHEITQN